jgi:cytoskeleton protein RodZ
MKTVGKQLQEARLAKNWTPELAARETKIKIERLRDLEADDYSHFSSPMYARGFVRTYARSLGMDEYKILRQLDNKLPDDDSSNIVTDTGVAYLPETAMPPRAAHRDFTGLYIVMGLGAVVTLVIAVVLFEAYRVGELPGYFNNGTTTAATESASTNSSATPAAPASDAVARALPVDSNTPPPIVEPAPVTNVADNSTPAPAVAEPATTPPAAPPRALPVDLSALNATDTNAAPIPTAPAAPVNAPRALPVDPSELNNTPVATPAPATATKTPPRALPVNLNELSGRSADSSTPAPTVVAMNNVPPPEPAPIAPQQPTAVPVMVPSMPAVQPAATTATDTGKRLVLTASHDSFVQVTSLDSPDGKPIYAAVLHSGQSVGFDGHKFSINVGVPSAVDIKLDGVNYGPHSDGAAPETFNVESHQP